MGGSARTGTRTLVSIALLLLLTLSVVLFSIEAGSRGDQGLELDVAVRGADDLVAGERGEVAVSVEIADLAGLAEDTPVRVAGALTGGGRDVEVAPAGSGDPVEVDVVEGRFLFPSDGELTAGDLVGGSTYPLELTLPEDDEPVELTVGVVPGAPVATEVTRLAGGGRFETAVAVSQETHPDGADTVYLTRRSEFADALAAGPPASRANAPLLLAREDSLPAVTRAEIERLGPDRVVLLGGRAALSENVAHQAGELVGDTDRVAGADRYETAALIAADFEDPSTVLVATGEDFADTLAGAPAAAAVDAPVLLSRRASLPEPTARALDDLAPERIVVLGGPAAIAPGVADELAEFAQTVDRVAGADRYETAVKVARAFFDPGAVDDAFLATGLDFPDALVGAPAAASSAAPMLLTQTNAVPNTVADELVVLEPERIYLLGTVGRDVAEEARDAATPDEVTAGRLTPGILTSGHPEALGDVATVALRSR